jgi:Putative glucoamylase/Protein of unknown function (DUF3131)
MFRYKWIVAAVVTVAVLVSLASLQPARAAGGGGGGVSRYGGLSRAQQATLLSIARDTWKFYNLDVDQATNLPMDNITFAGGSASPTSYGHYTSAANIGVYLWAVVSARDLGLISEPQARAKIQATLTEVQRLPRDHGFLYQWYDTTNGAELTNPGQGDCPAGATPAFTNCFFISNVDNGWYASGLIVVRQAMPELAQLADSLIAPMNFGLFYDSRAETHCNVNPAITGNQPTGQMFGGYYVGLPPDQGDNWTHYYHNGALYSDPRISAYIGMGLHQMPGNVWWRSWRELPPPAPYADCQSTDPDFSWQGQWPMAGSWQTYTDPQSGQQFPVWEGHYTYPGSNLTFIPTYSGGMFEGLMPNEIVPETSWGTRSFGLADARTAAVQIKYASQQLHYPVWGMSPSSTPDDTGGYGGYGVEGLTFPYYGTGATASNPNEGLSQCHGCATEDVVTPHASFLALDVAPQQAYANIMTLRKLYPGIYGPAGFFDAVNPVTGAIGHRDLVLDQSLIMASLDNALNDRALQRDFARDPVSWAARTYLSVETMSLP